MHITFSRCELKVRAVVVQCQCHVPTRHESTHWQ
jgi:hypothetical protein